MVLTSSLSASSLLSYFLFQKASFCFALQFVHRPHPTPQGAVGPLNIYSGSKEKSQGKSGRPGWVFSAEAGNQAHLGCIKSTSRCSRPRWKSRSKPDRRGPKLDPCGREWIDLVQPLHVASTSWVEQERVLPDSSDGLDCALLQTQDSCVDRTHHDIIVARLLEENVL